VRQTLQASSKLDDFGFAKRSQRPGESSIGNDPPLTQGQLHRREARSLGGSAAQAWLYPLLIGTATEAGIPAGVASGNTVVHKTGSLDAVENDAALVKSGPKGDYVLTVMTDGLGGDAGWQLIASVSSTAWTFEAARAK